MPEEITLEELIHLLVLKALKQLEVKKHMCNKKRRIEKKK